MEELLSYKGKVRNMYNLGNNYYLMEASDRVSSFDKHIGIIPGKGILLNKMSAYWFNKTKHIVDNHLLSDITKFSLVKKCNPIHIEFVIRGYITGNTTTSLWHHYKNGCRNYCGLDIKEGLVKNQKLDKPIITPTTKCDEDKPISKEEILKQYYITFEELEFIYDKVYKLFEFGQKIASKAGFILVDTKYEFGRDEDNNIILIDELHTCDSSRYWIEKSYQNRFDSGLEPEKLDKDCVRDWVKQQCDPYNDFIPPLPKSVISKAYNSYKYFYDTISSQ
jgi:phosphoribosylaminoimidazole-succinocarboxamide synthase